MENKTTKTQNIPVDNTSVDTFPGSSCSKFIKDVTLLGKYTKYKAKQDFFFDTRSERIDEITKALTEFILGMPKLRTDKSAMGRYKYQTLSSMLDEINPVLAKFGCKVLQPPHTIDDITYVVTMIVHISGQYFRSITKLPEEYIMAGKLVRTDQNLQALGGAQTYIKRYALKSMLGIDADDDNDGNLDQTRNNIFKKPGENIYGK